MTTTSLRSMLDHEMEDEGQNDHEQYLLRLNVVNLKPHLTSRQNLAVKLEKL